MRDEVQEERGFAGAKEARYDRDGNGRHGALSWVVQRVRKRSRSWIRGNAAEGHRARPIWESLDFSSASEFLMNGQIYKNSSQNSSDTVHAIVSSPLVFFFFFLVVLGN